VPKAEVKSIKPFLSGLGYAYVDETQNPVYRLFLR
jgi:threonine dehydratase